MKTVAARAGVSMMTVSLALRNQGRMAPETRRRVLRVADEVGYRPNPLVGALMVNLRTSRARSSDQTIAFLTSHPERHGWRQGLTACHFHQGAVARAERLGFKLDEFWLAEPGMNGKRMSDIFRARSMAGVVLAPLPAPGKAPDLRWDQLAPVALGYSITTPNMHRVANHHSRSLRIALGELQARGYRRIGLVTKQANEARADYHWSIQIHYHHTKIPAKDRIPPHLPPVLERERFWEWFQEHRPDVVLGDGVIVYDWLRYYGVRVPDDVAVAALDYYAEVAEVAGIDQNSELIGAAAVDLVAEQLYHNERGLPQKPKVVMIEGEWKDGPSIGSLQ